MDCNSIQEKISSYIDERLSPEEKVQVDEHLRVCPECRRSLEELKKTVAVTRGLDEVEPPPWLEQKVIAKIRDKERRKQGLLQKLFFPVHIKVPLEIVATLAIAVTAFFVFRTIEPEMKTFQRIPEKTIVMDNERDKETAGTEKQEAKGPSLPEQELIKPSAPPARLMRKRPLEKAEGFTDRMKQRREAADSAEKEMVPEKLYMAPDVETQPEARTFAPGAVGTLEVKEQHVDMIVRVHDIETSAGRIEEAVKRLTGEIVRRDRFENKEVLSVMIDQGTMDKLLQELKTIGEVQDGGWKMPLENLDRKVEIKIEVIQAF